MTYKILSKIYAKKAEARQATRTFMDRLWSVYEKMQRNGR